MKRKILSTLLTLCMVLALVPTTAFAEGETSGTPSVSAYATKAQLMDNTFAPNLSGNATNIGKLVFGKNSESNSQEWYILGKDEGVTGDNTIIFAASPIATNLEFEDEFSDNKTFQSSFGVYASNPTEVYPNHYGASDLRVVLQSMATNTSYFTKAEQGLMNATTVTTKDTNNSTNYTTTDKLYALQGDFSNDKYLWAGTSDSTVLAINSYWSSGDSFWLRSPYDIIGISALLAHPGGCEYIGVYNAFAVQPASNLNLSSVLFASAATAASSDTVSGTITSGTAMTLRFDGIGKNIGTATYNTTTGEIKAVKGSTSQTVALVVQGNDGTDNWYYSKKIDTSETIGASYIKSALGLSSDIDLSVCKIWLEITDTDGLIYAVSATETTITGILSVEITGIDTPVSNTALDTEASCATIGVSSTKPAVAWTPNDATAGYNKVYTASVTLTAATGYGFTDSTTATLNGNTATSVNKNADGTLTVTYAFPEIPDTVDPVISGIESGNTYCSAQTVTVSDNDAIEKVTVNGAEVNLDANKQFTLPANGEQTIVATDKAGNETSVTVTVNDGHTAGNDDGDCSTPVYCIYHPDTVVVAAKSHDFSGEWQKNGTDHWHVCQNDGCAISETETPHSCTDDGDCTTAVVCECGYVITAANAKHTYGEWQSNSDDTHTRYCTVEGCNGYEDGNCAGGEATCVAKAVCDTCKAEYGEIDSANHNLEKIPAKDATVTETGNTEYWHCQDCGKYFADENGTKEIKLEDTIISKLSPEIIEGKGQSITAGEKKELIFKSNAAFSDFIRVELDGKTLDEKNYTVKEGSTVVTLKADYVATLSAGEHTIGIVSESGTATTTFTVNAKAVVDNDTKSPQTGDNSHMALWIALLFMSGAGVIGTMVYGKKKRAK